MSQKKVDKYKEYKKNRRENIRKEKRKNQLAIAGIWTVVVVFIACVGTAIGVTFYNNYQAKLAALPTYSSTSFVLSDLAGIQSAETAEAQSEPDEESTDDETEVEESSQAETEESSDAEEASKSADTEPAGTEG